MLRSPNTKEMTHTPRAPTHQGRGYGCPEAKSGSKARRALVLQDLGKMRADTVSPVLYQPLGLTPSELEPLQPRGWLWNCRGESGPRGLCLLSFLRTAYVIRLWISLLSKNEELGGAPGRPSTISA